MAAPKIPKPIEVPRRRVFTIPWQENQTVNLPLPRDTVIVNASVRIIGSVKYTFTGTPTSRAEGTMDSLISAIEVNTDRLGTMKYMRPHLFAVQQMEAMGTASERLYSVGATANPFPTTEGPFTFGTTGQTTSISEKVNVAFEHIFCEPGLGRELTYFNTQRCTSANMKFYCGSLKNLVADPTAAALVNFTDANFTIEVTLHERADISSEVVFKVWKQIQKTEPFSGAANDRAIDIDSENKLSGVMLYAVDGSAKREASNKLLKKVVLKLNGRENLQEASFTGLQSINRDEYGIVAPWAGGNSRLDGFAHISQISRRELETALVTSREEGGVFSLKLYLDSNDSSLVAYTPNPATLFIVTEEITPGK